MSSFAAAAYHPDEGVVRTGLYLDDYFGPHHYGVQFDNDGKIYDVDACHIPTDKVFVPKVDGINLFDRYHRALEEIAEYPSSQPAALNIPDDRWQANRADNMQRIAWRAIYTEPKEDDNG